MGTLTLPDPAGVAGIGVPAQARWPGQMRCQTPGHVNLGEVTEGSPLSCRQQHVSWLTRRCFCVVPRQGAGRRGGWELGGALPGEGVDQCPPSCLWGWRPCGQGAGGGGRGWDSSRLQGTIRGPGSRLGWRPQRRPPVSLAAVAPVNYSQGLSSPCGGGRTAPALPQRNLIPPRELRWPWAMAVTSFEGAGGLDGVRGGPSQCQAALGGIRMGLRPQEHPAPPPHSSFSLSQSIGQILPEAKEWPQQPWGLLS